MENGFEHRQFVPQIHAQSQLESNLDTEECCQDKCHMATLDARLLSSPPLPSQEHNTPSPSLCPGQFLETGEISGIISKQISNRQTKTTAKIYAKVIPGKILKVQKLQLLLCISSAIKTVLSLRN